MTLQTRLVNIEELTVPVVLTKAATNPVKMPGNSISRPSLGNCQAAIDDQADDLILELQGKQMLQDSLQWTPP
jgi:hypothetical protein